MKSKDQRIRLYLDKCDNAVAGARGHDTTYSVACAILNGFDLTEDETFAYLLQYNQRCAPPWSDKELRHKAREAARAKHDKPRGHFLKDRAPSPKAYSEYKAPVHEPMKLPDKEIKLPEAMPNPTAQFLEAAFFEGESICIEPAVYTSRELQSRLDDDASYEESFISECERDKQWPPARPNGNGIFKTREEWIKIFTKNNDALASGGLPGVFVVVNPFPAGTKKRTDDAIEQFRHVLLEFDSISKEAQWNVIKESNVPCSAVIDSGGKSVHAWVRVDASTREEYDERAQQVFDLFATYKPDVKCGNPARLSRLPGARRGVNNQALLATNIGAEDFKEWAREKLSGDDGMVEHDFLDMLHYEPTQDINTIVGSNWLKRGGSLLMVGQSGIGKSSLLMQLCVSWALGRPLFGLKPVKPLKILIVQAENDFGDLSEQAQGVLKGLDIDMHFDEEEVALLRKNIKTFTDQTHVGKEFVDAVARRAQEIQPDLVAVDPLLSFIGDDISKQDVCSRFLRQWVNPVCVNSDGEKHDGQTKHKFAWLMAHHTPKPKFNEKGLPTSLSEKAYAGAGSAELVNWARAVINVEEIPVNEDAKRIFALTASKRGSRSGLQSIDGRDTTQIWLEHGSDGDIHWIQRPCPDQAELPMKEAKAKATVKIKKSDGKQGAPKIEISADWIESKLGDSQPTTATAAARLLRESWDLEGKAPCERTFLDRIKVLFDTETWKRKEDA